MTRRFPTLSQVCAAWLALAPAHLTSPARPGATAPAQEACPNLIVREPLLAFDVSGDTGTGLYHLHVAVYNDGLVSLAKVPGTSGASTAKIAWVHPAVARKLWSDVAALSAFARCDQAEPTFDMPLKTLTIFGGTTDAVARTFSWWLEPVPDYGGIEALIDAFVASTFP